jgi:hypothetical protein
MPTNFENFAPGQVDSPLSAQRHRPRSSNRPTWRGAAPSSRRSASSGARSAPPPRATATDRPPGARSAPRARAARPHPARRPRFRAAGNPLARPLFRAPTVAAPRAAPNRYQLTPASPRPPRAGKVDPAPIGAMSRSPAVLLAAKPPRRPVRSVLALKSGVKASFAKSPCPPRSPKMALDPPRRGTAA